MYLFTLSSSQDIMVAVECKLAAESLRFQEFELLLLLGFNGAEVRGRVDSFEVGADTEATGEGVNNTSFNKFKISSGVISKSGVDKVYG